MSSCLSPVVQDPVYSCVVNVHKKKAKCGDRNLNYKLSKKDKVGEWVKKPTLYGIEKAHNQVCFDMSDWLKRIKPKLKEGHDYYYDWID